MRTIKGETFPLELGPSSSPAFTRQCWCSAWFFLVSAQRGGWEICFALLLCHGGAKCLSRSSPEISIPSSAIQMEGNVHSTHSSTVRQTLPFSSLDFIRLFFKCFWLVLRHVLVYFVNGAVKRSRPRPALLREFAKPFKIVCFFWGGLECPRSEVAICPLY